MTNPESESGDIFRIENFGRIVELMKLNEINEVDIRQGTQRIRLRRGFAAAPVAAPVYEAPRAVAAAPAAPAGGAAPAAPPANADAGLVVIKSPMVGTFYTSRNPESPPFVKVGDQVGPESTLCIIEAMKVFNEIPAEISGKITAVLVQNAHPIEFGQPLFKVDPRG